MSIQSSINTMIGSIAAVKKAHDIGLQKQAMKKMEEQKLAIAEQKNNIAMYKAKTARKELNYKIRSQKEGSNDIYIGGQKVTDPKLIQTIKEGEKKDVK